MKNREIRYILFMALWVIAGCVKEGEVDRIPPEFEVISWTPEPESGLICGSLEQIVFSVWDTDTIKMLVEFKDEGGLSEVKIDIHNNFDCHGHRSNTQDWLLQQIIPLSGTVQTKEIHLPVPDNATTGAYHFGMLVADQAGNVTDQTFFYSINIRNLADTIPPVMEVISPQQSTLTMSRGNDLNVEINVMDNRPFHLGGNAGVLMLYRRKATGNILVEEFIDLNNENAMEVMWSYTFRIPLTWPAGEYDLIMVPYDGVRNEGINAKIALNIN